MLPSLRWHDPDQVRRSKVENLPLSPAHRTPVFEIEYTPRRRAALADALDVACARAVGWSGQCLSARMIALQRLAGDPDERRRDEQEADEVRLEPHVAAAADVCAERNGEPAATAATALPWPGSSLPRRSRRRAAATAEPVVAERDGDRPWCRRCRPCRRRRSSRRRRRRSPRVPVRVQPCGNATRGCRGLPPPAARRRRRRRRRRAIASRGRSARRSPPGRTSVAGSHGARAELRGDLVDGALGVAPLLVGVPEHRPGARRRAGARRARR